MAKVFTLIGSRIINRRVALFLYEFIKRGYKVYVFALPRKKWRWESFVKFKKINFFLCKNDNKNSIYYSIKKKNDTIIFCFHWALLPIAYLCKSVTKGKLIYDDFDFYFLNTQEVGKKWIRKIKKNLVLLFEKIFLPKIDLITCIRLKDGILKMHLEKYNNRVIEINNYSTLENLKIDLYENISSDEIAVCYIGGIYKEKGLDLIIEASKLISKISDLKIKFHLFGEGEKISIDSSCLIFHGYKDLKEIIKILQGKRCIGLLLYDEKIYRYSLIDGNSRKFYEYLTLGIPIITTDVGALGDRTKKFKCGIVLKNKSVNDLVNAILKLAKDKDLWLFYSKNCKQAIEKNGFIWEKEMEKFFNYLYNI